MTNQQVFSPNSSYFGGIQSGDYTPEDYENGMRERLVDLHPMQELNQSQLACPEYGDYQDKAAGACPNLFKDQQQLQQQLSPKLPPNSNNDLPLDEYLGSCFPASAQPLRDIRRLEDMFKSSKESRHPSSLSSSLELLNNYGSRLNKLNINQSAGNSNVQDGQGQTKLSTEAIVRVAGARYIQLSHQSYDDFSMLMHPFGYALSGLSEQETWDVELVHLLLAAAGKVGHQQFDRAIRLLSRCEWIANEKANPVQRLVLCFTEALRERIDGAMGKCVPKEVKCETPNGLGVSFAGLHYYQKSPLNQVLQLAAIQSIVENIGSARKLHVIDLEIRSGIQWTALMQALAEREDPPIKRLQVTAIGRLTEKDKMEETGKRLDNFAKSINFPFTFKVVYLSHLSDIRYEQIGIAANESVVVAANMIFRTMISRPECLEQFMRVINSFNPSLMVVAEIEANHNSPIFVNRFVEALFSYGAHFDYLDTCMGQDSEEHKTEIEAVFAHGISDMIAMEGKERKTRSVKIDVWRAFFSKFRMVEVGISESSLYQAALILKQSPFGDSCTLDSDGRCLLIGWKGTPLQSLSIWKFSKDMLGRLFLHYGF